MKKINLLILFAFMSLISNAQFWTETSYKGAFPVTDGTPQTDWTDGWSNFDPENTDYPAPAITLESDITTDMTLSGVVLLKNKVYVTGGATLTILPGTIIRGDGATQGTLVITKGSKIMAEGTKNQPIVFTSNQEVGLRQEGDWGGLILLGKAVNNQPGGVANIEGIVASSNTEFGGNDNNDNSGVLRYVRVEFGGIPLAPNKEINGVTFGSVGSGTEVDFVQVSFSGDDSFEWFGGTVDCRHLIAYRGIDDDFDTDFGYRGRVQFCLAIRDGNLYDAAGASNSLESDNDATGTSNLPRTSAVFSNLTLIGPKGDGNVSLVTGETFAKSALIRRNSSISVFNSLIVGWKFGFSLEGAAVEDNYPDSMSIENNDLVNLGSGNNFITATYQFYTPIISVNDTVQTTSTINWVNAFSGLGNTPDCRLADTLSSAATGADFSNSKFQGGFLSTQELKLSQSNFVVYPNPARENLQIRGNSTEYFVTVKDAFGRTVKSENCNGNLDISNLSNGVYTIQISTKRELLTQKFIKR